MSKRAALRIDTELTIHHAQTLFAEMRAQLPAKNYRLELRDVIEQALQLLPLDRHLNAVVP